MWQPSGSEKKKEKKKTTTFLFLLNLGFGISTCPVGSTEEKKGGGRGEKGKKGGGKSLQSCFVAIPRPMNRYTAAQRGEK